MEITKEYIIEKTKKIFDCDIKFKNNKYYVRPYYEDKFVATKDTMLYNLIEYLMQDYE